jgi:hypothetical protein
MLENCGVNLRVKLSGLWASTTLCYIYGDYFELYVPGKLQSMLQGQMRPLGIASQGVLLGTSIMLAIPSAMVALSLLLRPAGARGLNIALGSIYTLIMALVIRGTWSFYVFMGVVEMLLTATIVYLAWRWPKARDA